MIHFYKYDAGASEVNYLIYFTFNVPRDLIYDYLAPSEIKMK
jgi:hypothetical protein